MAIARWLAAGDRSACKSCQADQQVMRVQTDCKTCTHHAAIPTEIMSENRTPLKVFTMCRQQWRTGFSGAQSLDGNVVWRVIDEIASQYRPALLCPNKLDTFRRVEILATHYLHYQRQRQTNAGTKSRR